MTSSLDPTYQRCGDFTITKYLPIQELSCVLTELVHHPTGAKVLHIGNEDPENLFSLSFQTFPQNSNGVAHILEHTVLCGSKKFPVKDPFFCMTRRSLNTFMNAMTGQDFTCYPASSQIEKDFYNLLEVYLDAVFHPNLDPMSFLQEGHRLEFQDPNHSSSALKYQGIVYNEMKGAMSSIDSRFWQALLKHLTPDLIYAHNSGGDPKEIPSLTHEELIDFHRQFYHPSRCLFFFYGNIPLHRHLEFIEKHALSGSDRLAPLPLLPLQPRFHSPVIAVESYPIQPSDSLDKKTQIAFAWLTAPMSSQRDILALSLLDVLLMDTDGSLLKKALLKSPFCTQADSALDTEMSEVPWVIICKGCNPEDQESLKTLLFKTLEKAANQGFTQEQIEAALHQLEFERTEMNPDGGPFGLTLFMRAALIKQHGSDPELALCIHSLFKELRALSKDPEYLKNLIRQYALENPHFLTLVLKPDPDLAMREEQEEKQRLESIRSSLSKEAKETLIQQSLDLERYQEELESRSLDCLPKMTSQEVPKEPTDFLLALQKKPRTSLFHHACFTNHITYANLVFDLPHLDSQDLSLLSIFTHFLTEMGVGDKNYEETLQLAQQKTGGIYASLSLHPSQENPAVCKPSLMIQGKALVRNQDALIDLLLEFATSANFTDQERIQELLDQHVTSLQTRFTKHAMQYALNMSVSGLSIPSYIYEQWHGISYYQQVMKWKNNPKQLTKDLQRMQSLVLGNRPFDCILSGQEDDLSDLFHTHRFESTPSCIHTPRWQGNYTVPQAVSQARFIAAPVAFNAVGVSTIAARDMDAPFLLLSTELMQNTYLHKEIREKGGAYGAKAVYAPSTGLFNFYSYRDPHLASTLEIFTKALERIVDLQFTDQELEEAKLGIFQTLDAPIPPGQRGITAYSWLRSGRTTAMRQTFRDRIFSARREDVALAVQKHLLNAPQTVVSFLGEELFEKEKKKLKNPLQIFSID